MNKLVAIAGGSLAIYIVLALMMGVIPGWQLSQTPPGPGVKPLTPLQAEGREVYVANGCSYCHTQQVRPLPQDQVFGRPSAPGDFAYQTPELLGSERTGPDLTDVGVRRGSDVWQYIHLYNPRAVEPASIMPSFPFLFEIVDRAPPGVAPAPIPKAYAPAHGVVIPTRRAQALVAYLLSLKQPPQPAQQTAAGAPSATPTPAAAGTARTPVAGAPLARGKQLFETNCAACHQSNGRGLPGAFPALAGNAVANAADATEHIHIVLFGLQGKTIDGVKYASPMPAWGAQFDDRQIADLINYERSAWGNHGAPVTAAEVAKVRAAGNGK
ncbi:MAG: cytochrome c [Gammaproteobacteria bacterium]|nr:cytochrome c [Gammaproteobacteria bacterium]